MTTLLYLSDTYLFESTATIREIWENEHGRYIILDQTIFYPQWGGQPSDIGRISTGSCVFEVRKVRLDEHGVVYHFWEMLSGTIHIWDSVNLEIDHEVRIKNAMNHSAWHLIDVAIQRMGIDWKPTKWYHFPEGSYVEYSGTLSEEESILIDRINTTLSDLIEKDIPVIVSEKAISWWAPHGKKPRHVWYAWSTGCGCGGTHVRSSWEIWSMTIRKIKMKDGMIRVSYSIG